VTLRRVPLHRSLLVRLLATSILVALCAVAATAWIAVRSTSRMIQQEQGRSLADDTRVYDELLGYAATHPDWSGVTTLLAEQAGRTGRRITLADLHGAVITASPGADTGALPERPSAIVDALHVDAVLRGGSGGGDIDPRAVGPYRLTPQEKRTMRDRVEQVSRCLTEGGDPVTIVTAPSGRTSVTVPGQAQPPFSVCSADEAASPTATETRALDRLADLTEACVRRQGVSSGIIVYIDFSWKASTRPPSGVREIPACLQDSRREQLRPYVAPPARLYVDGPARPDSPTFDLSGDNIAYMAKVIGLVLLLVVLVTVLVGRRLIRPLRTLTAAAESSLDGHQPVPVTGDDEIGRLTGAFNDLAARRRTAERQRKDMVSDVAHELRTPLATMRIWLEAAQDGLAPLDAELLDLLNDETILLQHVVDDLRDLAAADSGSLTLAVTAVSVGPALRQVVDAQRGVAEHGGVDLAVTIDQDLGEVWLDPVRLRQIVGNLLSNALRHTPSSGRVSVRARADADDLIIEVADTGSGISAADLPHVFDRFWRADTARSRNSGGSGLGLAIARQLARAHGGELTAQSVTGTGSTFTLRLPRPTTT
jgi:two-component system sensor histidine kinase BaeS